MTSTSRTDKPDGTTTASISRRLPTEWETKIGADLHLAAPASIAPSDNPEYLLNGTTPERSTGAIWGNVTMPGVKPLGWDKTSIDVRLDPGADQGKVGATLSRSVPIGDILSVAIGHGYSVTRTLASKQPAPSALPLIAPPAPNTNGTAESPTIWAADRSLRVTFNSTGTILSAASATSSADEHWHNKLSVEQKLLGPLKMTMSVENPGTESSNKTITAGFKHTW
jgi:hypothetical protein